jgi:hypothetical protein
MVDVVAVVTSGVVVVDSAAVEDTISVVVGATEELCV